MGIFSWDFVHDKDFNRDLLNKCFHQGERLESLIEITKKPEFELVMTDKEGFETFISEYLTSEDYEAIVNIVRLNLEAENLKNRIHMLEIEKRLAECEG